MGSQLCVKIYVLAKYKIDIKQIYVFTVTIGSSYITLKVFYSTVENVMMVARDSHNSAPSLNL